MKAWLCLFGHKTTDLATYPTGCYITSSTESLVVSILSAGTFCGALAGAPMADIVGRKWGTVAACLVFSVGVAMQTGSSALALYVVGRVIAGFGVGLVSVLIPMYQSEWCVISLFSHLVDTNLPSRSSPKWIRGAVVAGYQWAITIGLLVAAVVNNATKERTDSTAWRLPTSIQLIWAFILASGMAYLPEARFLGFSPAFQC